MVSSEQAIALRKSEIERDAELAKKKYDKIIFNYAKTNSSYARTLRIYGLEYLHRLSKPAGLNKSDNSLIQQAEKALELDRTAINLHAKASGELSKDREIRFKEGLIKFEEMQKDYLKDFNSGCTLLVDFQTLVAKKNVIPACLLEAKLNVKRKEMRLKQRVLERIFLDVFEGTAIMSGKLPETTEEEKEKEAL